MRSSRITRLAQIKDQIQRRRRYRGLAQLVVHLPAMMGLMVEQARPNAPSQGLRRFLRSRKQSGAVLEARRKPEHVRGGSVPGQLDVVTHD
jgi:hypothetical protein